MDLFLSAAAATTADMFSTLKSMPWEKLGIGGIAYFAMKFMYDLAKARVPSHIMNGKNGGNGSNGKCTMRPEDSSRIGEIRHAILDRDGVVPRDHEKHAELLRSTADILKEICAELRAGNKRE